MHFYLPFVHKVHLAWMDIDQSFCASMANIAWRLFYGQYNGQVHEHLCSCQLSTCMATRQALRHGFLLFVFAAVPCCMYRAALYMEDQSSSPSYRHRASCTGAPAKRANTNDASDEEDPVIVNRRSYRRAGGRCWCMLCCCLLLYTCRRHVGDLLSFTTPRCCRTLLFLFPPILYMIFCSTSFSINHQYLVHLFWNGTHRRSSVMIYQNNGNIVFLLLLSFSFVHLSATQQHWAGVMMEDLFVLFSFSDQSIIHLFICTSFVHVTLLRTRTRTFLHCTWCCIFTASCYLFIRYNGNEVHEADGTAPESVVESILYMEGKEAGGESLHDTYMAWFFLYMSAFCVDAVHGRSSRIFLHLFVHDLHSLVQIWTDLFVDHLITTWKWAGVQAYSVHERGHENVESVAGGGGVTDVKMVMSAWRMAPWLGRRTRIDIDIDGTSIACCCCCYLLFLLYRSDFCTDLFFIFFFYTLCFCTVKYMTYIFPSLCLLLQYMTCLPACSIFCTEHLLLHFLYLGNFSTAAKNGAGDQINLWRAGRAGEDWMKMWW